MVWTGVFLRNVSDMYRGVDGYLGTGGFGIGGPVRPVLIDPASTATRLTLQAPDFLGEISFIGAGLQIQTVATPGGIGSLPRLTAGTLTRIEVRFNVELDDLTTALSLATTAQQRQIILAQIAEVSNLATLRAGPLNAVIDVGAISAADLGTAVFNSYQARSDAPLRAFLSQFNHNYTALSSGADIIGFDNADFLVGGPGLTNIFAGGGNDTLSGGNGGPNGLFGQGGADLYLMGAGADLVSDDGTDGQIDIASYANATSAITVEMETTGAVQLTGFAQGDTFGGLEGIIGSAFNDLIIGRTVVQGQLSSDILDGGAGDDTLLGGEGSDTLVGGPGLDVIDGGGNADQLGNPGPGDMVVYIAGPNEAHFFSSPNGLLVVTPRGGVDLVRNVELFSFAGQVFSINQLTMSGANLRIGDAANNALIGGAGQNLLFGQEGADTLTGGAVADILDGGTGNDRLSGEGGSDTLSGGDGVDTLNGGAGDDFLYGGESPFDLRDVIFGGDGTDMIDGGAGNDSLSGGTGADQVFGGLGTDTIIGNEGNDLLGGAGGSDLMFGNAGNDTLNGGFGFDRMNGGTGADSFFHLGVADHGSDWVQDYNAADGDVLTVGIAGATRAQFQINLANTASAGSAAVSEAFVIYRPTGQILWALVDGGDDASINIAIGGQVFDLLA